MGLRECYLKKKVIFITEDAQNKTALDFYIKLGKILYKIGYSLCSLVELHTNEFGLKFS
jgi:hypothetical protein